MKFEDKFKSMLGHINVTNTTLTPECLERVNLIVNEIFPTPTYPLNIDEAIKEHHEGILNYGKLVLTNAIHFDILQYRKFQFVSEYRSIPVIKMVLSQIRDAYDVHGIITPMICFQDGADNLEPVKVFLK